MKLNSFLKVFITFILFLSFLTLLERPAEASTTYKSKVNATSLNVRSKAGTQYSAIGSLKKNQVVSVSKVSGSWSYITAGKTKGWVSSKYLAYVSWKGYVNATYLNVRKAPSTSSAKLTSLKKGTTVTIKGQHGNWGKVYISNKKAYGWLSLNHISTKPVSVATPSNTVKTYYVTADVLNVRSSTSTSSSKNILFTIKKNEAVQVTATQGNWGKIKTKAGKTGWASLTYLSTKKPSTPPAKPSSNDPSSRSIEDKVIVLDAGHGGYDPGALGKKFNEKTLTLKVVQQIKSLLEKEGTKVVLTRSTDTYISLPARVTISHQYKADAFVSIHFNSGSKTAAGIETFYYSKSKDYPLSNYIREVLIDYTGMKNRGTKYGDLHVLRENNQPATLLELGFLSNPNEETKISTTTYFQKVASAVVEGLKVYFENK